MKTESKSLHEFRRSYEQACLDETEVNANPVKQFSSWFSEAESVGVLEPNAMILATVDAQGHANSRTVLLKYFDEHGFVFFTNYGSDKAREIELNPHVSLQFVWLELERQVKIRGCVEKISLAESMNYFYSRPKGSQIGAWVSHQSEVISSKEVLLNSFEKFKQQFQAGEVTFPKFWGGLRVKPSYFEFWQGGKDRLHDRIVYESSSHQSLEDAEPNVTHSNVSADAADWQVYRRAP